MWTNVLASFLATLLGPVALSLCSYYGLVSEELCHAVSEKKKKNQQVLRGKVNTHNSVLESQQEAEEIVGHPGLFSGFMKHHLFLRPLGTTYNDQL